jgi:hypothetical protein
MTQMPVSATQTWIAGREFATKSNMFLIRSLPDLQQLSVPKPCPQPAVGYTCILAVDFPPRDRKTDFVMGYTINGKAYKTRPKAPLLPAKLDDYEFGEMFFRLAEEALATGRFGTHPATVDKRSLYEVLEGLQLMRKGKVSGTKSSYQVEDTSYTPLAHS